MTDLITHAKRYDVYEEADKSDFQRRARILQSMWREEQGFEIGVHKGRNGERPLGSRLAMPWAEETLSNFLTETTKQVIRDEVIDEEKSKGKLYKKPRIFNDLLSSQPLCFNLFAELQRDLGLATSIFTEFTSGRVQRVTGIEFEFSPGRGEDKYTGDKSAFDIYIKYVPDLGGHGFLGVEVKYHENLKVEPADNRPRYEEISEMMGIFITEKMDDLKSPPLQQIWRDHLLSGILKKEDNFDEGTFVFLYPRDNHHCENAILDYRECLTGSDSFQVWLMEELIDVIKKHTQEDWVERFYDRYLNFMKFNSVI